MGRSDSLRRRPPRREPKRRLLIVTEGEVTEPEYFKALQHHCKALLEIRSAGVPKTCVEMAVNLLAQRFLKVRVASAPVRLVTGVSVPSHARGILAKFQGA